MRKYLISTSYMLLPRYAARPFRYRLHTEFPDAVAGGLHSPFPVFASGETA